MCRRILSAFVSVQEGRPSVAFQFCPGINILWGKNAEDVVLTLAGIFGGIPPKAFEAALDWQNGVALFVSGDDGRVFVDGIRKGKGDSARLMKNFHKQRFLHFRNNTHLLDGSRLPDGFAGTGDLLREKLSETTAKEDARPLFLVNVLERLDEAAELQPIFDALSATGRQVFIAIPHAYQLEGKYHDTTIHTL